MKLIDREMTSKVITTKKGQTSLRCQASFNSDGHICLRNCGVQNQDSDEIICLSGEETEAIFELFRKLNRALRGLGDLPF